MIEDTFCPLDRQEWRDWLSKNCKSSKGIWLIYYKKASLKFNLPYADARDEALCFGWIDSTVRKGDIESYRQYFSPRRQDSVWSKFNKGRIEDLIKNNLMTDYGLEIVERAKADGSYYFLEDIENMVIPDELEEIFKFNRKAENTFNNLDKNKKKYILYNLKKLKTKEARDRNIKKVIENLS